MASADYVRFLRDLANGARVAHERALNRLRDRDVGPYLDLESPRDVLDLANGRLQPQLPLLCAAGHRVIGVDLANRPSHRPVDLLHRPARWLYRRSLGNQAGSGVASLVAGSADALPFRDDSFDLVTSIAALEHFMEVPRAFAEVERVLRPGGVAWLCVHLFTSISGGHNVGYVSGPMTRLPAGAEPWDHLRHRRRPFSVPLNQWRRHQYLEAFAKSFRVITHYCAIREGEGLLSPLLRSELSAYDVEELTCGAYVIAGMKQGSAGTV